MQPSALRDSRHLLPAGARPRPLDRVLRELLPGTSWKAVRRLIQTGKVRVNGETVLEPTQSFGGGVTIGIHPAAPSIRRAVALKRDALIHVDPQVVVVNKPPGISTVPYEDEKDTLDRQVRALLGRGPRAGRTGSALGIVQRLDKNTSGLIVLCRTRMAKEALQQQFRARTVHRRYLALVHGRCRSQTISSRLVSDRGDGLRGSTKNRLLGREAVTHLRVLERFESATLVECKLETGRTHQIRIHLAEAGHPLVGERVYVRDFEGDVAAASAPRQMLHAAELGFLHPVTGATLSFEEPPPEDMQRMIARVRRR